MPPMPYPKIVAFVEGSMEQLFLNNNFHYVQVIPVSNGVSWKVPALCQQIVTFYKARDLNADAIIVWIDRERRTESAGDIEYSIRSALENAGAPANRIHILVCDMMTENIILADESYIKSTFQLDEYNYIFEGIGGKFRLKSLYKSIGITYRETTHGVAGLKALRLYKARKVSPTVDRFLQTFTMPCWWTSDTQDP